MGPLILLFWTSGDVCLEFQSQGRSLLYFLTYVILRFTSGLTPADCIEINMAAEPFWSRHLQRCPQVLVKVRGSTHSKWIFQSIHSIVQKGKSSWHTQFYHIPGCFLAIFMPYAQGEFYSIEARPDTELASKSAWARTREDVTLFILSPAYNKWAQLLFCLLSLQCWKVWWQQLTTSDILSRALLVVRGTQSTVAQQFVTEDWIWTYHFVKFVIWYLIFTLPLVIESRL